MGHTLLFAVDTELPHDGFRKARRLNLVNDLAGLWPQVRGCYRDRLAHRPHGNDLDRLCGRILARCSPFPVSGCNNASRRASLFAEAEFGAIGPHTLQGNSELAGDRHTGARHAAMLGDLHAPSAKAGPFAAARQKRICCLIERRAGKFIAAPADPALDVRLAGLVTGRRQAEMRTDVP